MIARPPGPRWTAVSPVDPQASATCATLWDRRAQARSFLELGTRAARRRQDCLHSCSPDKRPGAAYRTSEERAGATLIPPLDPVRADQRLRMEGNSAAREDACSATSSLHGKRAARA